MQLREIWYNKCVEAGGTVQLNALEWMSMATLDAIGKAGACLAPRVLRCNFGTLGFDYEFGTLNGHTSELAQAFEQLFRTDFTVPEQIRVMLNDKLPIIRALYVR